MTIDEIYKRIFKNFKILGLGKILAGLFSALTIFVLAQYLGVEIFGIIAITISIVEVMNIILNLRIRKIMKYGQLLKLYLINHTNVWVLT